MISPRLQRGIRLPWQIPTPRSFPAAFETPVAVEEEDEKRIRTLSRFGDADAQRLARHLAAADFHENEPTTMASSRFMRLTRIHIIERSAELLEAKMGLQGLFFVTLIPRNWFIPESQLRGTSVRTLKRQLRGYLHRAGIHDTYGLTIGHIEAAYCRYPSANDDIGFAFHVHLVGEENAREVFERMRTSPTFKRTEDIPYPIRVEPIRDAELRSVLGYCFKAFWRCRTIHVHPEGLDDVQRSHRYRLPEAALCEELLWRESCGLADASIVIGTRGMAQAFRHSWS